ncbi:hypothetical protein [Aureimonas altamirensis]|uniref:hypothetical protein n=1 Tax=Aureimonas altamirensis TaxID=370622 RepID=UPI002556A7DF|nr:hypothetical protein [Aureimonas altamirensis]
MKATRNPWLEEIGRYKKEFAPWLAQCDKINKIYLRDLGKGQRRFALLWSNISTLQPAVYSRVPQAVVSRRGLPPEKWSSLRYGF